MNKEKKQKKIKINKRKKYSYINAIDEHISQYFAVYNKIVENRECMSAELYDSMNKLLVEDYYSSIHNLETLAKSGMKVLKKKNKRENRRIFWYLVRRFFRFKKNEEIEKLIERNNKYCLELGYLFEDIISAKIREKVDNPFKESLENDSLDDEPDFVSETDKLFKGPSEQRALHGEIVDSELLAPEKHQELEFDN